MKVGLKATRYEVVGSAQDGRSHYAVTIEVRSPDTWAVVRSGEVLNKNLEWEYEPMPSSRTDEFKARTRFTFGEARVLLSKYFDKYPEEINKN